MADDLKTETFDLPNYAVNERLRGGESIHVRAIRPSDKRLLLEHFQRLSAQARYFRFFGHRRSLTHEDLVHFTELDFSRHVGLAATISEDGEERFIGIGRYVRQHDPSRAEISLAVLDQHQGEGIGSLLLRHLSRIANQTGITEFEADVMGDNSPMLALLRRSGCILNHANGAGIIHFTLRCPDRFGWTGAGVALSSGSEDIFQARSKNTAVDGPPTGENTMADFYVKDSNEHRQKLRQLKPEAARAFADFSKVVFADDALSSKTKNLIAVAVAHVTQCPWCIEGHTRAAKRLGATDKEIAEAVFVAMEMRAGAAFSHGAIAIAALEDHEQPH